MTPAAICALAAVVCAAAAAWQLERTARSPAGRGKIFGQDGAPGADADAGGDEGRGSFAPPVGLAPALAAARARPQTEPVVAALLGAAVGLQVGSATGMVVLGTVGGAISIFRRRRALRTARRRREQAAPAFARAMADALRGGAAIRGAFAVAAVDRAVPVALRREAAAVSGAIELGAPLGVSLESLAAAGGAGLRLLCGTILMHLEAGGALASELDRLAADGEASARVEEDRIAATAQARATVRVVAALPVLALLGAEAASGGFVQSIAKSPAALALLVLGFVLEVAAILSARLIVGNGR